MLRVRAGGPILLEAAATVAGGQRLRCRAVSPPQELVFESGLQMARHLEEPEWGSWMKGENDTRWRPVRPQVS